MEDACWNPVYRLRPDHCWTYTKFSDALDGKLPSSQLFVPAIVAVRSLPPSPRPEAGQKGRQGSGDDRFLATEVIVFDETVNTQAAIPHQIGFDEDRIVKPSQLFVHP